MSAVMDAECDVLIVGSGAAGFVAALAVAREGLKPLIVEKAQHWGGTSALSGGGIWIPGNHLMKAKGVEDNFEDALTYMTASIPDAGAATSKERKIAFLRNGAEMIQFISDRGVRLRPAAYPDYHQELPGSRIGRYLHPTLFDTHRLGAARATMRRQAMMPFAMHPIDTQVAARGFSSIESTLRMAMLPVRDRLLRLRGQDPVGCGAALTAHLMAAAQREDLPLQLNTPLRELIIEQERVVGAVVGPDNAKQTIKARLGVLLCAGGFAHSPEFRKSHQDVTGEYSSASPDDTGDIVKMADALGAATALLDDAWWGPVTLYPGGFPVFNPSDRALPFSIMIDGDGKRFTNESQNYNSAGKAVRKAKGPTWLILDGRHRNRYIFGAMPPGQTPKLMFDSGFFVKAETLDELAGKCGVDAANLRATVQRFNRFAETGIDEDFGRGADAYDKYFGDPTVKPNSCLGRIDKAPFLATRIYLGDLGTKGGLVTDEHARVLRTDGRVIEGLYGAGNSTASVMGRDYPGPGATLGPAMTFAYVAAKHMAQRGSNKGGASVEAPMSERVA